jgi:serine/threonine-protein kinase RsbW
MSKAEPQKIVLHSTFEEIDRLEPYLNDLKQWAEFGEDDYNRIMLALNEAVTNAITHGNQEQPEKKVTIISTLNDADRLLKISVQDEGEGFNPETIPDPLKDENLLNEGGRGVYLIKQYADGIEFTQNGTKVIISFQLET